MYIDKIQFKVYIRRDIVEEFKKLIARKYGKVERGLISREAEEALAYWLRLHTHRHTNSIVVERINPNPKVYAVFEQIKDYFRKKYKYLPQQVTYNDLAEAISAVRGSDRRTIRKWINLFMQWKLVKPIAPNVFELV